MIKDCFVSSGGDTVSVTFAEVVSIFHAQWLHDAQCEHRPSRDVTTAFCEQPSGIMVQEVKVDGSGVKTTLEVSWIDGQRCSFPAVWLRALAPVVAKNLRITTLDEPTSSPLWLADTLIVPEIPCESILCDDLTEAQFLATRARIFDILLQGSGPGIIKITNLPIVDTHSESTQKGNILTQILKRLFGSVFQHPRRGPDETFKVASHYQESAKRAEELPNYNTSEVLFPHTDHSHYENPARVQGLHAVEGSSENTFIDGFTVLATLQEEDNDLFKALCKAPMVLGRVAQFYKPSLYQATVDTAVRLMAGSQTKVRGVRWHPHLTGFLVSPFDEFEEARRAHQKFQEIVRRNTHMLRVEFRPGDLYIWDNFRILHGRERILETPRLAIGQTVTEQTVNDEYRLLKINKLRTLLSENWLVQTPTQQLDDLVTIFETSLNENVSHGEMRGGTSSNSKKQRRNS